MTTVAETTPEKYLAGESRAVTYEYDSSNPDRFQQGSIVEVVQHPDLSAPDTEQTTLLTTFLYDPVTVRPVLTVDPLGREYRRTFGHHELSYSQARILPRVADWGILDEEIPSDPDLWGKGDVNEDSQLGGTYEVVLSEGAPMDVALTSDPGDLATGYVPTQLYQYNGHGQVTYARDGAGTWERFTYDDGVLVAETLDPGGLALTTHFEYDEQGRVTEKVTPDGRHVHTGYDGRDLPIFRHVIGSTAAGAVSCMPGGVGVPPCQAATGIVTYFVYDAAGRPLGYAAPELASSVDYTGVSAQDLEFRVHYAPSGLAIGVDRQVHDEAGNVVRQGTWTRILGSLGRVKQVVTPSGATYAYARNARGDLVRFFRQSEPGGETMITEFDHDVYGNEIESTAPVDSDEDGAPDTTTARYDGFGRLIEQVSGTGQSTRYYHDPGGRVHTVEVRKGAQLVTTIVREHDAFDRIASELRTNSALLLSGTIDPLPQPTIVDMYGYGPTPDRLRWTISDDGHAARAERYDYDAVGRLVAFYRGAGTEVGYTLTLDAAGRVTSKTVLHDSAGREGPVSPSESTWTYAYDQYGFLSRETDPIGAETKLAHDAFGRVKSRRDPTNSRVLYTRDSDGSVVARTEIGFDGLTRTVTTEYDVFGHVTAVVDAESNRTEFEYDSLGRRTRRLLPVGEYAFEHDALDRLVRVDEPGGSYRMFAYDADARVRELQAVGADADVTRVYEHDQLGNARIIAETVAASTTTVFRSFSTEGVLLEERTQGAGPLTTLRFEYDGTARRTREEFPSGLVLTRDYDALGRPTGIQRSGAGTVASFEDLYGMTYRSVDLGGAMQQELDYDAAGRVLRSEVVATADVLTGATYEYDGVGNLLSRNSSVTSAAEAFENDGFHRLKEWDLASASSTRSVAWQFDDANNFTDVTDTAEDELSFETNSLNQYTSVTPGVADIQYSSRGDESARSGSPTSRSWQWDALGRPITCAVTGPTAVTVSWTYDGLDRVTGRQSSRSGQTWYRYADDAIVRIESDAYGVQELALRPDGDVPLWRLRDGAGESYYHVGPFHNVDAVVSADGSEIARYAYDPYGTPRDADSGARLVWAGPTGNELLFSSASFDFELDASRLGRRTYDVNLGRFVSRDPLGEAGGLNLYAYAGCNPFLSWDPTGLGSQPQQEPLQPVPIGGSQGDIIYAASFAAAMDEFLARYADELGLEPGTRWADLNAVGRIRALTHALDTTNHLIDLHELRRRDALPAPIGAPNGEEVGQLRRGAGELTNALIGEVGGAVLDLPGTIVEVAATELFNVDAGTARIAGAVAGVVGGGGGLLRRGIGALLRRGGRITMDQAVELGVRHVDGRGVMEVTGRGTNFQFRNTFRNAAGDIETRIGRFDINHADPHVQRYGPHLNLETRINGVRAGLDPHLPIDPTTIQPGDFP